MLDARKAALAKITAQPPKTLEIEGTVSGLDLHGSFHNWHQGGLDRFDENLGVRTEQTLRISGREYIVNSSGNVRELRGVLAQRQKTQDFIDADGFVDQPQFVKLLGPATLSDGRKAVQLALAPPGGEPETISLDATTWMIDRVSFADDDGTSTIDYSDYRVTSGALLAYKEVDSNGDHPYDVTQVTTSVRANVPIAASIFAIPASPSVTVEKPVTVPLRDERGHLYTTVTARGKTFHFLIDSGSQSVVIDSRAAAALVLVPEGQLEISGAARSGGVGVANLDSLSVGGVDVPIKVVSVLDLSSATTGAFPIDGILGFPFFAAAEVRIDPEALTMTIGRPGALQPLGEKFPVEVDRELPELQARINGYTDRFLIDTGNNTELLLFNPFVQAHPALVPPSSLAPTSNFGIGGTIRATRTHIGELDLGTYRLFNIPGNVMQATSGAFADQFEAGNIGMATLRNFVMTFDLANDALYLQAAPHFDDGRYRPVTDR